MADKEEQLLERELVFEQVTRLADRVRQRADTGKDDTLNLAKKVRNGVAVEYLSVKVKVTLFHDNKYVYILMKDVFGRLLLCYGLLVAQKCSLSQLRGTGFCNF